MEVLLVGLGGLGVELLAGELIGDVELGGSGEDLLGVDGMEFQEEGSGVGKIAMCDGLGDGGAEVDDFPGLLVSGVGGLVLLGGWKIAKGIVSGADDMAVLAPAVPSAQKGQYVELIAWEQSEHEQG